ncbi:hypothetical protein M413DRAFT_376142 [Hebeloma cylindrosporum]|uniref:TFIIS N-terminal domain-containing protein n=1 Tax=Hebeloma cylindrosporum TaxID=76867 RepID=A0A0C2YT62_HEBCY|nr:hypothetical protein M413DRAFT_376142 [Hebeloma cylindrosporum h7]
MSEVQELNDAVKQLQSAETEQDFLSILTVLKQRKHVTEAILRETKVGLAVGKLRMHKAKAVANLAKEIVSQWKRAVEKAKLKGSNHKADSDSGLYSADKKASVTPDAPLGASASCRSAKADGVTLTGDKTRDRCVQLIYDGLVHDSAFLELVSEKAHEAEKIVYENMGGLANDYKAKIASCLSMSATRTILVWGPAS